MPGAAKTSTRDLTAEISFLTRALKAPTMREAVTRVTERARTESWSHEEFLVACLQREFSARESHGGECRIRTARFPARKSLEDFDFEALAVSSATSSPTSARWTSRPPKTTSVFLGSPRKGDGYRLKDRDPRPHHSHRRRPSLTNTNEGVAPFSIGMGGGIGRHSVSPNGLACST